MLLTKKEEETIEGFVNSHPESFDVFVNFGADMYLQGLIKGGATVAVTMTTVKIGFNVVKKLCKAFK